MPHILRYSQLFTLILGQIFSEFGRMRPAPSPDSDVAGSGQYETQTNPSNQNPLLSMRWTQERRNKPMVINTPVLNRLPSFFAAFSSEFRQMASARKSPTPSRPEISAIGLAPPGIADGDMIGASLERRIRGASDEPQMDRIGKPVRHPRRP